MLNLDPPRPANRSSVASPRIRIDALTVLRFGFALVVPALILAWSLIALVSGQSSRATPRGADGSGVPIAGYGDETPAYSYQAGQDAATPTPTIEVYDPNKAKPSTPTPIPQEERAALFDDVWSTVEQNYLDPSFNGADWAGLRDEYRPRALDAPTAQDFYGAIVEMVDRLNDGRSTFTPPDHVTMSARDSEGGGFANIGVTRVYEDNSLLVLYVYPGGPADKGGIKRRDRITAIDGKPVTEDTRDGSALSGIVGSKVALTVRSPGGQTRDVTLTREIVIGRAPVLSRQLAEDPTVAYLGMPTMAVANVDFVGIYLLSKMYRQYLVQDVPLKGLVVDLRQTSGNSPLARTIILGEFTDGTLGRFDSRNPSNDANLDVPVGPLHDKYAGVPLVLLVDGGTQSDAEIMAAALQAQGRAQVVGTRTAGNTVSNATYTWTSGRDESQLSIPQWRYFLPDGSNLDGRGVTPDLEVSEDWTEHTEGSDPYIQAAVSLLHSIDKP